MEDYFYYRTTFVELTIEKKDHRAKKLSHSSAEQLVRQKSSSRRLVAARSRLLALPGQTQLPLAFVALRSTEGQEPAFQAGDLLQSVCAGYSTYRFVGISFERHTQITGPRCHRGGV